MLILRNKVWFTYDRLGRCFCFVYACIAVFLCRYRFLVNKDLYKANTVSLTSGHGNSANLRQTDTDRHGHGAIASTRASIASRAYTSFYCSCCVSYYQLGRHTWMLSIDRLQSLDVGYWNMLHTTTHARTETGRFSHLSGQNNLT